MPTTLKPQSRLYLVDIVKVFALALIILYDCHAALWSELRAWPLGDATLWDWWYYTCRSFTYAGFVVLAVFSFLAGYKKGQLKLKNLIFLVLFSCVMVSFSEGGFNIASLWIEWDIYHYLVVNILCVYLCTKVPRLSGLLAAIGMLLYFVPWPDLAQQFNLSIDAQRILTGYCNEDGRGGWHLLPWIGLSWILYWYGKITAEYPMKNKIEIYLWMPVLGVCFANWGAYSNPPMSLEFYCYVFSKSSLDFWIQMMPVMFLFRLSTYPSVQNFFEKHPRAQWVSNLYLARHLGLAFILHIFVYYIFGEFDLQIRSNRWLLEGYFILILPLMEYLTKGVALLLKMLVPARRTS